MMKYRIKNEDVEKAVRGLFKTQEAYEKALVETCTKQLHDPYILMNMPISSKDSLTGGVSTIGLLKMDIEEVVEYDPKVWNEYSKVKPPKKGYFRVELRNDSGEVEIRSVEYWDKTFEACYLSPKPLNLFFKPWDDEEGEE